MGMVDFLKLIGGLIFFFGFCYLIAAMGNHGKYTRRHQNDMGCAIILFVGLIICGGFYAAFGNNWLFVLIGVIFLVGWLISGYFNWQKERKEKENPDR